MLKCPECEFQSKHLDSLRNHAVQIHQITSEDFYIKVKLNGVRPTCKCGCGKPTKFRGISNGFSNYVWGHASRVNNNWGHNENAFSHSLEKRREMWKNGEIKGWCSGLTKEDPRVAALVEKMNTPERAKKISESLSGKQKSDEHKKKISENMKVYWSKEENRNKQSVRQAECIKNGMLTKATRVHGYFEMPTKSKNTVYYRSLFELNAVVHLECDNNVISYTMEPFRIEYEYEGKIRNYIIDCLVEYVDGKKVLIEFKPNCHLKNLKNIAKFEAAEKFALKNDMLFEIWSEKTHPFLSKQLNE